MEKRIFKLDIPVDYIVTDCVGIESLDKYIHNLYRLEGGIFILCTEGTIRMSVNLSEYEVKSNDFITLMPDCLIELHYVSCDIHLYIVGFSSESMISVNLIVDTYNFLPVIAENPVTSLYPPNVPAFKTMYKALIESYGRTQTLENKEIVKTILMLIIQAVYEIYKLHTQWKMSKQNRENEIYRDFMQLIVKHYKTERSVAFYAEQIGVSLPHFCTTIRKASNRTPREIISMAIIRDAKTQLKSTSSSVKSIAFSLGFNNLSFFNKFFKRCTGMTPQHFRRGK